MSGLGLSFGNKNEHKIKNYKDEIKKPLVVALKELSRVMDTNIDLNLKL